MLFALSLSLSLNIHKDTGRYNWQSEIYADGAGYYAYLPATFLWKLDYDRFPKGIEDSVGCRFIDHKAKKFVYKYTCGVALLVSSFFAATDAWSAITGLPADNGFSPAFHRMADVAAVFYLILGLFLTGEVLKRHVSSPLRYVILLALFAGTNLYFYALRQPLMSHVYAFATISLFIFALQRFSENKTFRSLLFLSFAAALAILVRPVNGIILLLVPFWEVRSVNDIKERLLLIFTPKHVIGSLAVFILVLLPQMLYWYYMFGSPVHYAYKGETFSNLATPRLAEIWFAPMNGLFLYNPVWLLFVAGTVWMIFRKDLKGIVLFCFFLLFSYVVASWHSWFFGCGYGHRAFIDILPLFAIPFGVLAERVTRFRPPLPGMIIILLIALMSYYNLRLIYSYSGCFIGSVWDWPKFSRQLRTAGFIKDPGRVFVFTNDFESGMVAQGDAHTDSAARSYNRSILFNRDYREGCRKSFYFFEFAAPFPTHADYSIYINAPEGRIDGAMIHCTIERKGSVSFRDSAAIDPAQIIPGKWCKVAHSFVFPPDSPWDATISFRIRSSPAAHFFADDQKIVLY